MSGVRRMSRAEIAGEAPSARKDSVAAVAAGRMACESRSKMLVIGVDPSNTPGYAAWKGGKLLESGSLPSVDRQGGVRGVDIRACWRTFSRLRKEYAGDEPGVLVVENQYPIPDRKPKPGEVVDSEGQEKQQAIKHRGLEALMREVECRAVWEAYVVPFGWDVIRPHPMSWQTAMLSRKPGMKRPEIKALSMAYARSLGARPADDDEADAINLSLWWCQGGNPPEKKVGLRGRHR